jgi:SAM-dependent methyltransferase
VDPDGRLLVAFYPSGSHPVGTRVRERLLAAPELPASRLLTAASGGHLAMDDEVRHGVDGLLDRGRGNEPWALLLTGRVDDLVRAMPDFPPGWQPDDPADRVLFTRLRELTGSDVPSVAALAYEADWESESPPVWLTLVDRPMAQLTAEQLDATRAELARPDLPAPVRALLAPLEACLTRRLNPHRDVDALRNLAGLATPMALRVAVTLGLPDRLRGDGVAVDRLAAELGLSATALDLLLRHLATLRIVEHTATGYRTTDHGATLCADADNGLVNFLHLDMAGGRAELAFVELLHSIVTGNAGYNRRYGQDFWADLAEHPRLRESFDKQMTDRIREQLPQIVAGYDWSRFATIVDVGGGNGTVLAAILAAHPRVDGHVVDLDPTATEASHTFRTRQLDHRARATAGSFFDPLPTGAQAYLLCDILHDWDDDHAHRILRRCAEAVHPTGRVLVIEPIGGRHAATDMDLAMLAIFGGRERRLDEFRALAAPHGLVLDTVTDLTDQRCLLEFRRTTT